MNHIHAKLTSVDATLALHCQHGLVALDFLAQGRSQIKRAGIVTGYNKRNPERRALFNHVLSVLASAQGERVIGRIIAQRFGKGAGTVDTFEGGGWSSVNTTGTLTHKGPLRMALFVKPAHGVKSNHIGTLKCLAKALGLSVVKHRPTPIEWPSGTELLPSIKHGPAKNS